MAQRGTPVAGKSTAEGEVDGPPSETVESSTNDKHLHPATQHPLFPSNSPLRHSFTTTPADSSSLQRRRNNASDASQSDRRGTLDDDDRQKKAERDRSKLSTMDKLEGWFGIDKERDQRSSSARQAGNASLLPKQKLPPRVHVQKSTRLVLVHIVMPSDSLEGLALRYNTDVGTLRRANGLWPGDSVQVRKEVYIPVDEDAAQRQDSSAIQEASEEESGKLSLLLNGMTLTHPLPPHSRSMSVTSASSSGATSISHAQSASAAANYDPTSSAAARLSPPELRRLPAHALSYFPPPGSSTSSSVAESKKDGFGYGPGLRQDDELQPGESGVEDLLQLAERARTRGANSSEPSSPPKLTSAKELHAVTRPSEEGVETASSPALSSRGLDESWKPNKYTLGQRNKRPTVTGATESAATQRAASDSRGPPPPPLSAPSQSYQGWNDIPEPPLSQTAKGKVAHAYKTKRRYPRPGLGGVEIPGTALIEDLAAGLPPNPGPAANWARPIGDSLPVPPEEAKRRAAASASNTGQGSGSSSSANTMGWGQIISDTVRGKMRIEDALERGYEDIRAGLTGVSSSPNPPAPTTNRSINGRGRLHHNASSQRPSAEMARVALAGRGREGGMSAGQDGKAATNSTKSGSGLGVTDGPALRRSSGRSLHELEDLRVESQAEEQRHAQTTTYKTWSAADSSRTTTATDGSTAGRRTTVRNVDWLG